VAGISDRPPLARYNATSRSDQTIEVNRTTWSWFNATLADGANGTHPYMFFIASVGLWKVQFLLFKDGGALERVPGVHLFAITPAICRLVLGARPRSREFESVAVLVAFVTHLAYGLVLALVIIGS
jgi:hypothetical protein